MRLGSSNRRATRLLTDDLARGAGSRTFDRRINPQADIDDIDPLVLERLLGRPIGEEELLALELVGRENERLRPTRSGTGGAGTSPPFRRPRFANWSSTPSSTPVYSYGGTAIKVVFYDRAIVVESTGGLVLA